MSAAGRRLRAQRDRDRRPAATPATRWRRPAGRFTCSREARGCGTGSEFVARAIENKLLIIPGRIFSRRDTHFRISYAASDRTLERGLEVLRRLAKRLNASHRMDCDSRRATLAGKADGVAVGLTRFFRSEVRDSLLCSAMAPLSRHIGLGERRAAAGTTARRATNWRAGRLAAGHTKGRNAVDLASTSNRRRTVARRHCAHYASRRARSGAPHTHRLAFVATLTGADQLPANNSPGLGTARASRSISSSSRCASSSISRGWTASFPRQTCTA